jgi:hypothetical protein
MIAKGGYKLTTYYGYPYLPKKEPLIELYNIAEDPEELVDLSASNPGRTSELLEEVISIIETAELPYQ